MFKYIIFTILLFLLSTVYADNIRVQQVHKMYIQDQASANRVGVVAPSLSGSWNFTLPVTQGTGVFFNDGTGATSWKATTRTINAQTGTTYTFALSDGSQAGTNPLTTFGSTSSTTVTVPPNSSVAFPVGTQIECLQVSTGTVTFAAGVGVTINSNGSKLKIAGQYVGVSLVQTAANVWALLGALQ